MNKKLSILSLLIISFCLASAQKTRTDANIIGHVTCEGVHIPFANVTIKGTTIGTSTDETGHFQLVNLPEGNYTVAVSIIGYKPAERDILITANTTAEIKFEIEEDILNLEEVVVSADRSIQKRTEAPVIINTISSEIFRSSHSLTIGEGLNFSPGLRLENNCQNCGFAQVRMNGMEGPYSQILINSRRIFSGLAGVYGLELIPANMIERVEVVRGGGSALFGSNAIAGTINIILKNPVNNSYEAGFSYGLTGIGVDGSGPPAPDLSMNFNTSLLSEDAKTGMSLYGFYRDREKFDANEDDFTEISQLKNLSLGTRVFHRFNHKDRLSLDAFFIHENREGGNMQEYPLHERDIAEAITHNMLVAGLSYERYFRDYDMLTVFASGQFLDRDSYYGAEQSLSGYGNSVDNSINIGAHYKAVFGRSSLVTGIENSSSFLNDQKLGYSDYENSIIIEGLIVDVPHVPNTLIADQASVTNGAFLQYELSLSRAKITAGGRFDHYSIEDKAHEGEDPKTGSVFSPRLTAMYSITESLKARVSYSHGYRAPQIFDEDLHVETSGSRQVIHKNDPDLKQESSRSYMASLDFNGLLGNAYTGLLIEGFYTTLIDAFANEIGTPDENGQVIYKRTNAEGGATVTGLNLEFKLRPAIAFSLTSGFTLQSSKYETPQDFNEKIFFRSPNQYGYLAGDWDFAKNFCLNVTGNYTGKMLIPYFGPDTDPDVGELRESDPFFELGTKINYTRKLNGASIQFFTGIRNVFNSYQDDFDTGMHRDPAYVYGPLNPRTIYFGIKLGNMMN